MNIIFPSEGEESQLTMHHLHGWRFDYHHQPAYQGQENLHI